MIFSSIIKICFFAAALYRYTKTRGYVTIASNKLQVVKLRTDQPL